MPQREHRVRLATTKGGLEVDDRRGVRVSAEPVDRSPNEIPEPVGEVGAVEELDRVAVVPTGVTAARRDLEEVGSELRGPEVSGRNIFVGREYLTPRSRPGGDGVKDGLLDPPLVVAINSDPPQLK